MAQITKKNNNETFRLKINKRQITLFEFGMLRYFVFVFVFVLLQIESNWLKLSPERGRESGSVCSSICYTPLVRNHRAWIITVREWVSEWKKENIQNWLADVMRRTGKIKTFRMRYVDKMYMWAITIRYCSLWNISKWIEPSNLSLCVCVVCCVSPLLLHYSVWHTALGIIGFRCNCIKSGHQVHTHTHTNKISLCHSLGSLLNRKWQAFEQFQSQFSNLRIFFSIILKTCMRFHKMSDGK